MIVTDDLDEYVALKGLVTYCSHKYDSDCGCGDCPLGVVCIVTVRKQPYKGLRVEYIPGNSITADNSLARALKKTETLDKLK